VIACALSTFSLVNARRVAHGERGLRWRDERQVSTNPAWVRGTNLAWGFPTAAGAVSAWMASPGHRANILDPRYTSTTVACAGTTYLQRFWG
jgi:uncharacterized protein YkwD